MFLFLELQYKKYLHGDVGSLRSASVLLESISPHEWVMTKSPELRTEGCQGKLHSTNEPGVDFTGKVFRLIFKKLRCNPIRAILSFALAMKKHTVSGG